MRRHVLLIIETAYAYGRSVLAGINDYMVAHEPWSVSLDLRGLMVPSPPWLGDWVGDGIISRSSDQELVHAVTRRGLPTIDLTDIDRDVGLPHIWTDHYAVGEVAAGHLLERGFTRFAFCGFSGHEWSDRRRIGFERGVAHVDIPAVFETPWIPSATRPWESERQELYDWIQSLPRPVGILACNDVRGQHILDVCRSLEVAVPEEVAVIGVDDDELLCQFCDPPLSSVVPNAERIGFEAAEALDTLMRGHSLDWTERIVPPIGVVTRQSTDVLAIDDPQIAAAVRLIRERACSGLTVAEVLREIPLSRSVLERRFRKHLGRSPQAEIRNVQLKRVKQLLRESDLTLDRIAGLTGFEHPEYLSVVFRREIGQTPGNYRSEHYVASERRERRHYFSES